MVRDCTGLQKKKNICLPEEKRVAEAIKERITNRLKVSYRWIKNNMRREILNYSYSVKNGTGLCDKARILQSSNNCLSKFMQRYNSTKKKCSSKKVNNIDESRVRLQNFHSYFHHMICTKFFITLIKTT